MKNNDFGYCYAIEFDNGTIKIGKSTSILKRLMEHKRAAGKFNVEIVDILFTDLIPYHSDMEKKLLSDACSICDPTKSNEYFNGLSIYDCIGMFHNYGVNYIRTKEIPKLDDNGNIVVLISRIPDKKIFDGLDCDFSSFDKDNQIDDINDEPKDKTEITKTRIIEMLKRSKSELAPSVICQRCASKKYDIRKSDIMNAINEMSQSGELLHINIVHGKNLLSYPKYYLPS